MHFITARRKIFDLLNLSRYLWDNPCMWLRRMPIKLPLVQKAKAIHYVCIACLVITLDLFKTYFIELIVCRISSSGGFSFKEETQLVLLFSSGILTASFCFIISFKNNITPSVSMMRSFLMHIK